MFMLSKVLNPTGYWLSCDLGFETTIFARNLDCWKFLFNIDYRSECQDEQWALNDVSSYYFLSQPQPHLFTFQGQNGKTTLSGRNSSNSWTFEHYNGNAENLSQLAELRKKDIGDLIGMKNWNVKFCGERSSAFIKFTNVSLSIISF